MIVRISPKLGISHRCKADSEDHYSFLSSRLLFASLTYRQAVYHGPRHKLVLAVCSHSTRERHTVVYPKGKYLFKTSCTNRWPYFNCSVLDPGQVAEINNQRIYKVKVSSFFRHFHFGIVFIGVDFPHMSWCCPVLSTIYRLHCQIVLEKKNGAHITISVGLYTSFFE